MYGSKCSPVFWSLIFALGFYSCTTSCLSKTAFVKPVDFDSFEMRFSFKAEKKITAAAMNVTTAPRCQAAHIHQIHTAMPKHAFRGKKKQEKKHWLESGGSLTQAPLGSARFQLGKDFVLFKLPSCCAAKGAGKMKKGGAASLRFFALLCIVRLMSSASLLSFCNQHFEKVSVVILPRC